MKAGLALVLLMASCVGSPPNEQPTSGALTDAYGAMRDARICAALDPRTEIRGYWQEVERTENLLFEGWQAGLAETLFAAKLSWEEVDEVSDKICPFQEQDTPDEQSLKQYAETNDAIEAAIAAEAG